MDERLRRKEADIRQRLKEKVGERQRLRAEMDEVEDAWSSAGDDIEQLEDELADVLRDIEQGEAEDE